MNHNATSISLGFSHQQFEPGVHICQIYSSDEEREDILLKYLLAGIKGGERAACFSEYVGPDAIKEFLGGAGFAYDELNHAGALSVSGVRDIYFADHRFDPDRMLGHLRAFHGEAMDGGYAAARVIGDMLPAVHEMPGGSRLLEYESRVTMLLRECPITSLCQYDCREFDGSTIVEVLKVHPLMVVRGSVFHNPFYIAPEDYLQSGKAFSA
jgi:hypothetical protein